MKKLNLDDLQVESFATIRETVRTGTVRAYETEQFHCYGTDGTHCWGMTCDDHGGCTGETLQCTQPPTAVYPCTWEPRSLCATNEIAYPSECTGCGQICNPTGDYCPGASYPDWNC